MQNWVRQLKNSQENFHDKPCSGRPSLITNNLVTAVHVKVRENKRSMVKGGENLRGFFIKSKSGHSDFYLFRHLENDLGGKVKSAVKTWLSDQIRNFYNEGFQNLIIRYDKRF